MTALPVGNKVVFTPHPSFNHGSWFAQLQSSELAHAMTAQKMIPHRTITLSLTLQARAYGATMQPGLLYALTQLVTPKLDITNIVVTSIATNATTNRTDVRIGAVFPRRRGTWQRAPAEWKASALSMFDRTNCDEDNVCPVFSSAASEFSAHIEGGVTVGRMFAQPFSFLEPYVCADGSQAVLFSNSSRRALLACTNKHRFGGCVRALGDGGLASEVTIQLEIKFSAPFSGFADATNRVAFAVCEVARCKYNHDVSVSVSRDLSGVNQTDILYDIVFNGESAPLYEANFQNSFVDPTMQSTGGFLDTLVASHGSAFSLASYAGLYNNTMPVYWCGSTETFNGWMAPRKGM
jgi:hypothetical protein